jgi:hypothetical protein
MGHNDTKHDDTQHNDTQHNNKNVTLSIMALHAYAVCYCEMPLMLNVAMKSIVPSVGMPSVIMHNVVASLLVL